MSSSKPSRSEDLAADVDNHHIEGFVHQSGRNVRVPLISNVTGNLWQGGCIGGVSLGTRFAHVISLYPWERYTTDRMFDSFVEVKLIDSRSQPIDRVQLVWLARHVLKCTTTGPTLVHCQAGLNRSGLVTGTALVLAGMDPDDAIALLRKRSDQVLCNVVFASWLRAFSPAIEEWADVRDTSGLNLPS